METTTSPIVRPAIGTDVRVSFPGSLGYDADTIEGVVIVSEPDSFDVWTGNPVAPTYALARGELFTIYDVEQADPALTITVLS